VMGLFGCQPTVQLPPIQIPVVPVVKLTPVTRVPSMRLVVFFAEWCRPCKTAEPIVAAIELAGVYVVRYDIEQHRFLARSLGVNSVPTYLICKGMMEVGRTSDVQEAVLMLGLKYGPTK